jgi:N-acetylglutamate synthase-like GNAT family acetyltransferase
MRVVEAGCCAALDARTETLSFRTATAADAAEIHTLVVENLEAGHLLPRSSANIEEHAARFLVAEMDGAIVGCAELAPLSDAVAEVRSLVVDQPHRGRGIGGQLVRRVAAAGASRGFATLCAFTHEPSIFVRLGFSIVPHVWVPEKIAHDCTGCSLFRRCGQYAVTLALRAGASVRPERPAAVIHGRGVAARRSNIERIRLQPVACADDTVEAVPA